MLILKKIKTDLLSLLFWKGDFHYFVEEYALLIPIQTNLPVVHNSVQKMALLIGNEHVVVFWRCFK